MLAVGGTDYVENSVVLYDIGWEVRLLTPAAPARAQALSVLFVLGLMALLLALSTAIILGRRARAREREQERKAAQEELERKVRHRTADLNAANERLLVEIEERRATEERLRTTQKELVQAVKSYAENAATYLDRKRVSEARENVTRISQMADRMATLSGHLRNFARRPQETIGPVDLSLVLDDALDLMAPRLSKAGAVVDRAPETAVPLWVMGGRVRLQQVFVNLISNALDAMEKDLGPKIAICRSDASEGRVRVSVSDRGPGLEADAAGRVFDPFFTTKSPGKGLGLGLSISYNIVEDFGGHLSAANNPDGVGACFTVDLVRAEPPAMHKDMAAE